MFIICPVCQGKVFSEDAGWVGGNGHESGWFLACLRHAGQLALRFDANDRGGMMLEENVVSKSGTTYCITDAQIRDLITDAAFIPKRRNCFYKLLE